MFRVLSATGAAASEISAMSIALEEFPNNLGTVTVGTCSQYVPIVFFLNLACAAGVSVGFSARSRNFSLFGGAKIGTSACGKG